MEPKTVLAIIMALVLSYFIFGKGSRILKKKSHHYIVPPASKRDPNWIPLPPHEYQYFIFFVQEQREGVDELQRAIISEFPAMKIEIERIDNWFKIKVLDSNFSDFHQLIAFCDVYGGESVIAFGRHSTTNSKDYIAKLDEEAGGQHLIGAFRTNQNFGVYLPKAQLNVKGNVSKSPVHEVDFKQEFSKIVSKL